MVQHLRLDGILSRKYHVDSLSLSSLPYPYTFQTCSLRVIFSWAVFPYLHQRKNLGLHTDVMLEPLFRLQEQGVIDNTQKSIDPNRSVVAQAHGSQDLYEFLDRNPGVEFHSVSYINDPIRLSQIDNLAVIEGALKVDLTGQIATDSIAHKFYGGVWSVDESIRGAKLSEGGKPLIALPARSLQGRSNIVFELPPGTGVSISRSVSSK